MPEAFDNIAKEYDTDFTYSKIGRAQRAKVHEELTKYLKNNSNVSILEINCGTGEDALFLSNYSNSILATDISKKMIEVAKQKDKDSIIDFAVLDINNIHKHTFNNKFDFIFSNFGGLNCLNEKQLSSFFNSAHTLLNPEGTIIAVLMPKYCIWEIVYYIARGKFNQAFRRIKKEGVSVILNNQACMTWYYNPNNIKLLSKPLFKNKKVVPIGLAIPPSYLEKSFLTNRPWFSLLLWKEKLLSFSFFSAFSDHYLIQLQKQ